MSKQICILGAGAWGTAIATLLAHNGHRVKLWCYEADVAAGINQSRYNQRYLPGIELHELIFATTDFHEAFAGAAYVFEATPIQFLRSVLEQCTPFFNAQQTWVALSKGIEQQSLLFPADILQDMFGSDIRVAVVGGPGFAHNLAIGEPTAALVASSDDAITLAVMKLLSCDYFKPFSSADMVGIQLCGAIKNVLSLGVGMLEGAGYGDNTRALFLTAGYQEMLVSGFACEAEVDTLYGLAGFGDLVLSAMGGLGKNLALGKRLGAESPTESQAQPSGLMPDVSVIVLTTAEGMNSCLSMEALATKVGFDLPILCGVQAVVEGKIKIQDVVLGLMRQ